MHEKAAQFALILGDRLIDWCWAADIIKAGEIFMSRWWPEGAIVTNLTELLRGL